MPVSLFVWICKCEISFEYNHSVSLLGFYDLNYGQILPYKTANSHYDPLDMGKGKSYHQDYHHILIQPLMLFPS